MEVEGDLNLSIESLTNRLDASVLALVAVHMYGLPAGIAELEPLCRTHDVFLIDDAAHALGIDLNGRPLGSFGDAGIYSFAQGKVISTGVRGSGGALLVNNPLLADVTAQICGQLKAPSGRLDSFAHFTLAYQLGKRFAALDEQLEWLLEKWAPQTAARRVSVRYHPALISNLDADIALIQLKRLTTVRASRQRLLDAYVQTFSGDSRFTLPQAAKGRFLSRLVCRLPHGSSAGQVRRRLLERNIETRLAYPAPSSDHPALVQASTIQGRLIELPLHPDMTERDVHWVYEQLNEVC